ncbi:uncharacterized protein LOC111086092, partial [Paramuricea clavata]
PYPLTRGLAQYLPPASSKNKSLPFDEATTFAAYQKQPVDDGLKKVVRCLKNPLNLFHEIILRAQFSVTIKLDSGDIQPLYWELTIRAARIDLHCGLDALGVIYQGLFHSKILLKHVQQILDEDKGNNACADLKKSSKEVQKLRELNENLLNLNKFLDCVLLHYSSLNCSLPSSTLIKEIKHTTKKIYQVIKQLKSDSVESVVLNSVLTEEDVLCSVLGLNDDFANRLRNLSEEMRQHKTDMYFLLCFIKEGYDSLNVESLHDTDEVARLQKMGFTENRSNVIAKWIAEQPFPRHKSLFAWAQIYIENLFKYDIFLNDHVSRFPYEEHRLNEWFSVDAGCDESEDGCVSQVSVINTTTHKDACRIADRTKAEFEANSPKENFYFHGTDHKSAQNILENGINLREGQKGCDFSHGCGFYVADKFECALEYAMKSKAAAVVLFNLNDDCLKKGLDLSDPERHQDLQSVREYFQSGEPRNHRLSKKLYKNVKNCNYIIGPISRDGISRNNTWEDVQQICVRNQKMADEIGRPPHVVGIVFLNLEDAQLARKN